MFLWTTGVSSWGVGQPRLSLHLLADQAEKLIPQPGSSNFCCPESIRDHKEAGPQAFSRPHPTAETTPQVHILELLAQGCLWALVLGQSAVDRKLLFSEQSFFPSICFQISKDDWTQI